VLNSQILDQLAAAAGPPQRALAATHVGAHFTAGGFTPSERQIAEDIFFLMVRDVAEVVREALSHAVKLASDLPIEVARALANDAPSVALPFLAVSEVLGDADLISVIALRPAEYALAIAQRARVSEPVSNALVATENKSVVSALAGNKGAEISEPAFEQALAMFSDEVEITSKLAARDNLPMRIAERLVTLVSEKVRHHLVQSHGVSDELAGDISDEMAARSAMNLLDQTSDLPDIIGLVEHLSVCRRLTPTLIMRGFAAGDIDFAETAIAKLATLPASTAHQLIWSGGGEGLSRLFVHARIPGIYVEPVKIALEAVADAKSRNAAIDLSAEIKKKWQQELPSGIFAQLVPLLGNRSAAQNYNTNTEL
jgi:uncharacterized protein (DUF2336 family)